MEDLTNRVALITGASRGIGRAIAEHLGSTGARIAVNYHSSEQEAQALVGRLHADGSKACTVRADVSNPSDITSMVAQVEEELGPIDVLINNAGAIFRPADWQHQKPEDIRMSLQLNLAAAIMCVQKIAPGMRDRNWGRIVNISSTYGQSGAAAVLSYSSAKAGLLSLTRAMARELAPDNITVNSVSPANVQTDMTSAAGEDFLTWAIETTPLGRLGTPSDIAHAVLFLLRSSFITGHDLVVDGGHSLGDH